MGLVNGQNNAVSEMYYVNTDDICYLLQTLPLSLIDCCFDLVGYVDAVCLPHEVCVAIDAAQRLT